MLFMGLARGISAMLLVYHIRQANELVSRRYRWSLSSYVGDFRGIQRPESRNLWSTYHARDSQHSGVICFMTFHVVRAKDKHVPCLYLIGPLH